MGRTSNARERLIDAAHALIWEFGYGVVTIEAICARAKVKKGSFYYFFDSKVDLAVASIEAWWEVRRQVLEKAFHPAVLPLERITTYFQFVAQAQLAHYAQTGQVLGCPIFTLGSEITKQESPLRERLLAILEVISDCLERAVHEAMTQGYLNPGDAGRTARGLTNLYFGTLTRARIENDPEAIKNLSADILTWLLQGQSEEVMNRYGSAADEAEASLVSSGR